MKIRTNKEFSGVPKGTTGEAHIHEDLWKITWDLPKRFFGVKSRRLEDWFDQDEFDKYLVVLN